MRRLIAAPLALLLLGGFSTTPAGARYGTASHVDARISSGYSGWQTASAFDGTVAVVKRSVQPGKSVAYEIRAHGTGPNVPNPVVRGCDSAPRFDVRYMVIRKVRPDLNITAAVETGYWEQRYTSRREWRIHIRLTIRVDPGVKSGTSFWCPASVNWAMLRAVTTAA
jgi:hypothetical protein